jgi:ribulose-5-phosphate 4-epimerase/fuculose-1-phosphate aldolase
VSAGGAGPQLPAGRADGDGVAVADTPELRRTVATACRILAHRGLVDGILGHVSVRVSPNELVIRCRGAEEPGLAQSRSSDICRITLDGEAVDVPPGYAPPNEMWIHTEVMRRRPEVGAVIHAHPPSALLVGLAGLRPRAVFGAYNIPALRLALAGIPVYPRPVLITRRELAGEMVEVMGGADVCLLRGHGVTIAAPTIEAATTLAVDLDTLLVTTLELARLGAVPPELSEQDLAELPDLGSGFNHRFSWQALVAALPSSRGPGG